MVWPETKTAEAYRSAMYSADILLIMENVIVTPNKSWRVHSSSLEPVSELQSITCHVGSRSVSWHRWTRPALTPARQAGTQFIYPRGMKGWVDLGGWLYTEYDADPSIELLIGLGICHLCWFDTMPLSKPFSVFFCSLLTWESTLSRLSRDIINLSDCAYILYGILYILYLGYLWLKVVFLDISD